MKIIAQNITNLTDARYFAAWGVNYLSYNLTPDSPFLIEMSQAQEIKEWVEGPETLVEAHSIEFLDWSDGHILSHIYSSLPLNKPAFYRTETTELKKGLPTGKYIISPDPEDIDNFLDMIQNTDTDVDIYIDIQHLSLNIIKKLEGHHLAIQGGDEEKVGVKSFDELDDIFEWLEDVR